MLNRLTRRFDPKYYTRTNPPGQVIVPCPRETVLFVPIVCSCRIVTRGHQPCASHTPCEASHCLCKQDTKKCLLSARTHPHHANIRDWARRYCDAGTSLIAACFDCRSDDVTRMGKNRNLSAADFIRCINVLETHDIAHPVVSILIARRLFTT